MKTAQEYIEGFKELAPDQKEKVINFIISVKEEENANFLNKAFEEEYIQEENYSLEDIAVLNCIQEEAEQEINMSPALEGKAAIDYLTELEKQAQA